MACLLADDIELTPPQRAFLEAWAKRLNVSVEVLIERIVMATNRMVSLHGANTELLPQLGQAIAQTSPRVCWATRGRRLAGDGGQRRLLGKGRYAIGWVSVAPYLANVILDPENWKIVFGVYKGHKQISPARMQRYSRCCRRTGSGD